MEDAFVLFQQHGEQHRLKGQEMRGVCQSGNMIARAAKEVVERVLILFAEGAAKFCERALLVEDDLGEGR